MNGVPSNFGGNFYRNLLSKQGRYFYDRIIDHFSKSDYSPTISLKLSDSKTAASDCFSAIKALKDDRPEFFFIGNQSEFTRVGSNGTLKCTVLYKPTDIVRINVQLSKLLNQLVKGTSFLPVLQQQKLVYERIAKKLNYVSNNSATDHNIVGPLLYSSAVCEGYNALLLLCLRKLCIPCIKVYGKSKSDIWHCWTIAWINGQPVHCDVTWDKPTHGILHYNYLNLSDRQISADHSDFSADYIPKCSEENLNYYRTYGLKVDSQYALNEFISRRINAGQRLPIYVQITFKNDYKGIFSAVERALYDAEQYRNYGVYVNSSLQTAVIITG